MSSLSYSSQALDTLPKFHRKSYVIYVEGIDDIPFWNIVFQTSEICNYIVKPAGGSEEIEKYSQSILQDNAEIYVARDSHFKELLNTQEFHLRILWTYGHSIENTLYHPVSLAEIISIYARIQEYNPNQVESWLMDFTNQFFTLLICEVGNEKFKKETKIIGCNCAKFLQSNKSHLPAIDIISEQLNEIRSIFSDEEYSLAENLLNIAKNQKPIYFIIRGHFLTKAVENFIKHEVKRINSKEPGIPHESLFTHLISIFKSQCLSNSIRPDIQFLKSQISMWNVS